MPLSKSKIAVPFVTGLETKSDDKQQQFQGFQKLKNVRFDSPQKLIKRSGYSRIKKELINGTFISNPAVLSKYETELGLMNNKEYFAYSPSINRWSSKGRVFSAYPSSEDVVRNNLQQKNLDMTFSENIAAFCYEDSSGCRVTIIDTDNDNVLLSNQLVSASGTLPKIVNVQNEIFIFYTVSNTIRYKRINLLFPNTLSAEQTPASDLNTPNAKYDIEAIDNRVFIAYNSSDSGGTLKSFYIEIDNTVSSTLLYTGENASDALSVSTDSALRLIIGYSDGSDVKVAVSTFNLGAQILNPTSIETISNVVNVTVAEDTVNNYKVFYEISAANVKDHYIKSNTISISGTVGTPEIIARSVGLASKTFKINNEIHITSVHDSQLQATYFILNDNGEIVSKISPGLAGGLLTENGLPKVFETSTNIITLPTQIKGRLISEEGNFFSSLGVNRTTLDFSQQDPFQNEYLGENLHIAGGIVQAYDGRSVTEQGFHLFPEDLTAGATSTTGGSISDGQYQYVAVYRYLDNKGNNHQSAPSIPLTITLSGSTATQQQTVNVPTLRLTAKENVVIDLYRTEAAGTVFYKVTSTTNPTLNDPTVNTIAITDVTSDANLIDNEILYTTGGVLDNISAPASTMIEIFNDRVFLAGLENPNALQYSKKTFSNTPVEFNDSLIINVNSRGGNITAIKAMDDKLIIFKESALFYLSGDGPNNLGQQDTFIIPDLVSSDIGCININSVVLTPQGLMFKSQKGIYLLSRNMQLSYIGDNVEAFNDDRITSAVVIPEDNQVRFTTNTTDALVYNYYTNTWATFDNHRALSAVSIGDDYYYLRPDGTVFQQQPTLFTDDGSPVKIRITTGWISFSGLQGFQRVYKMLFLSEFKSPHKLRVRVAYDFNEAFTQEVIVDTANFTSNQKYGDNSPYGIGSPYGGTGNVHQFRVDLKQQKCQALKIEIEEIQTDTATIGEGLSISNVLFEVGAKQGVNKLPTTRQYGTN